MLLFGKEVIFSVCLLEFVDMESDDFIVGVVMALVLLVSFTSAWIQQQKKSSLVTFFLNDNYVYSERVAQHQAR